MSEPIAMLQPVKPIPIFFPLKTHFLYLRIVLLAGIELFILDWRKSNHNPPYHSQFPLKSNSVAFKVHTQLCCISSQQAY